MVTAGSFRAGGLFIFAKEMINIAIKLATSITYTADGSQTNFSVPFDYLRPSFVHVAVDDAEVSEGFTVSNRMVMFDSAPAKDAVVHIYRNTPTTRLVSWADASILKAIDMTIAEVQQLHILEEGQDWSKNNSIALDVASGAWQGRNHRMTDIADPQEPQDVMTLNSYNNHKDGLVTAVNAAATTAVKKCEEAVQTITSTSTSTIDNINNVKQDVITTVTDNSTKATETIKTLTDTTVAKAESEANRAESEANRAQHLADKVDVSQYAMPVGFAAFTVNPNLQAGWLPLLGGEYSRTAYADLWAWVQTQNGYLLEESAWQAKAAANGGNVPFYSKGDGSTTFRVPALKCWLKGAGSISEVGGYLAAGLPNIEGTLLGSGASNINNETYFTGAFAYTDAVASKTYGASERSEKYNSSADFKASRSSDIYGASDTVQPPSIVGLWCVKAYGTITNVGSTDVSNIASGLTSLETRFSTDVTPIRLGGTGATTAHDARSNLGVDIDVLLADATLLWQNPSPTSSFSGDSLTLSQPYTNFKRLLFITSVASNGYTFVNAGFVNVDVLSANIELARNNGWTYVTYMVGATGSGIYGDVSMITTTALQYSTRSGLRPQFVYGYK